MSVTGVALPLVLSTLFGGAVGTFAGYQTGKNPEHDEDAMAPDFLQFVQMARYGSGGAAAGLALCAFIQTVSYGIKDYGPVRAAEIPPVNIDACASLTKKPSDVISIVEIKGKPVCKISPNF